ncbi:MULTISPECIES: hypothetical protein [unclassified Bacteroides]|jgi:hypothetical protein|uniref:hypothetical protein n=1 Tax=unclassified Bacteroides TaxID=2646097 RepID=UPI000E895246|nr:MULTISPECIES: hypothetical protein [unclassified Bacteroides]RGN42366.1 hypothetical protein DXB63_17035 [Bacteroides sp. OM05-12]RHR68882.1 hypothetical protein DWW69_19535 [Bacteroides sp. AF16-49]DAX16071.1 MAG TPA: hypothetical protein [Caudoviricetes sp.]
MKLIYSINADMSGALCVAKEIVSITGMTPELIEVDESTKVKYNKIDSFKVEKGEMGIEDYINRNKIIDK